MIEPLKANDISPSIHLSPEALCLAILEEQRRSRRWSNLFKFVALTFVVTFFIAIYSNQYVLGTSQLTSQDSCGKEIAVSLDKLSF